MFESITRLFKRKPKATLGFSGSPVFVNPKPNSARAKARHLNRIARLRDYRQRDLSREQADAVHAELTHLCNLLGDAGLPVPEDRAELMNLIEATLNG